MYKLNKFNNLGITLIKVLISIAAFILMILLFNYIVNTTLNKINNANNIMKSHLGDTVIINKDTSIIIDYNIWNSTYKLSNGIIIDENYINK